MSDKKWFWVKGTPLLRCGCEFCLGHEMKEISYVFYAEDVTEAARTATSTVIMSREGYRPDNFQWASLSITEMIAKSIGEREMFYTDYNSKEFQYQELPEWDDWFPIAFAQWESGDYPQDNIYG